MPDVKTITVDGVTYTLRDSSAVNDVTLNGSSIVNGGVADITDAIGNLTLNGRLISGGVKIQNTNSYSSENASDVSRYLIRYNSSNNLIVGSSEQTADYNSSSSTGGNTVLYGYNVLFYTGTGGTTARAGYFSPNKNLNLDGQIAALYKVTEVSVSVAAINAHANINGSSHAMTAQTGYNAVGIVGWSTSNFRISPATNYVASNTSLYAGFKNTSATNVTSTTTVTFRVLWLKGTSA